jgi:hypothetical protein
MSTTFQNFLAFRSGILNDFWNNVQHFPKITFPDKLKRNPNVVGLSSEFLGKIDPSEFNYFIDKFVLVANYDLKDIDKNLDAAIDEYIKSFINNPLSLRLLMESGIPHDAIKSKFLSCVKEKTVIDKDKLIEIFSKILKIHDGFHSISQRAVQKIQKFSFSFTMMKFMLEKLTIFYRKTLKKNLILKTSTDEAQIALTKVYQIFEFLGNDLTKKLIYIQGNSSKESLKIELKNFAETFSEFRFYQLGNKI